MGRGDRRAGTATRWLTAVTMTTPGLITIQFGPAPAAFTIGHHFSISAL